MFLFPRIRGEICTSGHDPAFVAGVRHDRGWRQCDSRCLLLHLFAYQPHCRRGAGSRRRKKGCADRYLHSGGGLPALQRFGHDSWIRRETATRCRFGLCFHRCGLSCDARFFGALAGHRHRRHTVPRDAGWSGRSVRGGTGAGTRRCLANGLAYAGCRKSRNRCVAVRNYSSRKSPARRELWPGIRACVLTRSCFETRSRISVAQWQDCCLCPRPLAT